MRAKSVGGPKPNIWRQSGELPKPKNTGATLARVLGKERKAKSVAGKAGLDPTDRQIANAKRADKNLRKFSWE